MEKGLLERTMGAGKVRFEPFGIDVSQKQLTTMAEELKNFWALSLRNCADPEARVFCSWNPQRWLRAHAGGPLMNHHAMLLKNR